jgi:hypothetical protein
MPTQGLYGPTDHSMPRNTKHRRSRHNRTATATATTDGVPLRARVAAGVRHKPPCNVEVTARTCQQKGCATILITTCHQAHTVIAHRDGTAKQENEHSYNENSQRPTPSARRCQRPSRAIAPHQGDRARMQPEGLTDHPDHNMPPSTSHDRSRHNSSAQGRQTRPPRQLTFETSRSDRASLPASVTSHRARSR